MATHRPLRRGWMTCLLLAAAASVSAGCFDVEPRGEKLYNSVAGVRTIVVAPMMNLSAEPEVDMVEVTNAFGSELQQVQGVSVVPIGRVYQFLAANKMQTVGSPDEARELARVFQADACIVGAITEYDPYNPPRLGLAVQMYTVNPLPAGPGTPGFDPVAIERSGVPLAVTDQVDDKPRDAVSRVFDGRSVEVEKLARLYSREHLTDDSPFGWRLYLADQHAYIRLCCYGVIREMIGRDSRQWQMPRIIAGRGSGKWPK